MFEIVLHRPEIPPNTGNVMRLAANTGCRLHLIRPLGFRLDDRALARAGMDYRDRASVAIYDALGECLESLGERRVFALTTRGARRPDEAGLRPGDVLLFGAETAGLPSAVLDAIRPERRLRLPMIAGSRSLNLANAVAVTVYEGWRQNGFAGAA